MKLILQTENPSILESVRNILNKSTTVDFWETLSKEQQDEITQFYSKYSSKNYKRNSYDKYYD